MNANRSTDSQQAVMTVENCKYVNWLEYPDYILMHRHENMAEITLITQGKGRYAVNNHMYDIQVGDVVLCGCNVVHDAFMQEREHYGTLTVSVSGLQMEGCPSGQFLQKDQVPVFHSPRQFPEIYSIMKKIREEFELGGPADQKSCDVMLGEVLRLVSQMTHDEEHPVRKVDSFCLEIEEYINVHYGEDLSLESVAKKFYVSAFHLSHLFKKETGYNFKQYLMRMRIGEAQKILSETDKRVIEIAQEVGYEDASYFSRAFQKETGMTPKEYRKYTSVM
ncbi:MAG: helix-turn-helix transcriptional regulator [Eubacterium sp.]|nr:helix-turn-helix transcriptional regulator [Eubacterium sp.]